jgi:hypothetical protein
MERLGWRSLAVLLLVYSILLHVPSLHSDTPIHSDSPGFFQALALLRGQWNSSFAPARLEYPVYPYLMFLVNRFVPNWLLAAKLAAFFPSVLVPVIVFGATLILSADRVAALFAGFLAASSPPLILFGSAPLYDSTFIFAFALFMLAGFLFIAKPDWSMAILVGVVMGLCWTARGLGLFLVLPFLSAVCVLPGISIKRKCGLSLVAILFLFGAATLIRLPAKIAIGALPPDQINCVKEVMVDGMHYAGGNRDTIAYQLNENATAFQYEEAGSCQLSWKQFESLYYKAQFKTLITNLKQILIYDLVAIVAPFIALFVPLTLGGMRFVGRRYLPEGLFLGMTCVSFLVFVAAIQYQTRYLFAVIIPISIVAGTGCAGLLREKEWARWTLALLMIVVLIAGIDTARHTLAHDKSEANYRKACEWIVEHEGEGFRFGVMEKHHGVYAYLKHGLVMLPVDEPQRARKYAEHMNVKYVLAGPEERSHNPMFLGETAYLRSVAEFGTGSESVQVLEMIRDPGGTESQ